MNYRKILLITLSLMGTSSVYSYTKDSLNGKIAELERQIEQVESIESKLSKFIEKEIDRNSFTPELALMTFTQISHSLRLAHLKFSLYQLKQELKGK